ncbi:glycosyltransferase involved in cell wall biosynthesis [Agromyces hippuratus]|uniref:Glycosyltransferase involved in cell wall biosynthesis n=1 Tax=Agromyces hippuratus TaxID=286438 RepID=A0A852WSH3_9MICO|nr:glycosyltransferase [Agromyces hippuratus]NYG20518.1 glycosyltransferase involved in cell wall biosynthesis [Agromyces hippuratus]
MTLDIMMPFYGRIDHFKLAVESVLAQSDPDWRLTIIDDVYPDPSAGAWAAAIADARVTYLRNDINLGVSGNFHKAVSLMRERRAVIMGCDDVMLPGFVGRVRQIATAFPDAAMIQPGVEVIDADGAVHRPLADRVKALYAPRGTGMRTLEGEQMAKSLLQANWLYFPSIVWDVERLKRYEFRADLNVVQDLVMHLEFAKDGGLLVADDEIVFRYRRHGGSVSAVTGPDGSKFAEERQVFREAARDMDALGWHRAARAARVHLSSRLHAAADLPKAVLARDGEGFRSLARHTFGGLGAG